MESGVSSEYASSAVNQNIPFPPCVARFGFGICLRMFIRLNIHCVPVSPAAIESAVRLLEEPSPVSRFGDMLETGGGWIRK